MLTAFSATFFFTPAVEKQLSDKNSSGVMQSSRLAGFKDRIHEDSFYKKARKVLEEKND
jgi:hypothetical protein